MFIVKRTLQSPRQLCQSVYSSGLAVDVATSAGGQWRGLVQKSQSLRDQIISLQYHR